MVGLQTPAWGVGVSMYVKLHNVDIDIVMIHVNVNISSDCFVTDKFAVAIGMLFPALIVTNSTLC